MTLEDALSYIHRVDWRGSVPGLSRIDTLLGMLGHPERAVKYIHITGTNGKGSTCAMLAAILRQAGYKTGLYTSPYIFRFNERMQINGTPISDDALCALVEELQPLADSMADHPTEFELVTAMALTWFARERCDIVVCEVGMGGEFDATNVIPSPEAAVLTNIGLDHTAVLGDTVEQIAADVRAKTGGQTVGVTFPILSRNRFSLLLQGIAAGVKKVVLMLSYPSDEVGNHLVSMDQLDEAGIDPWHDVLSLEQFRAAFGAVIHPFTGVDYVDYYKTIIESAGAEAEIVFANRVQAVLDYTDTVICCDIHTRKRSKRLLAAAGAKVVLGLDDLLTSPVDGSGYNLQYGLLGSNKADDDRVKLFPRDAKTVAEAIGKAMSEATGKRVEAMVYGDGAFKDPAGKIWELADPVVSPGYTSGLVGTPNELKLKYLADKEFAGLSGQALKDAISQKIREKDAKVSLVGNMVSEGTTPRNLTDLIGSLCDLTSGSGDKGTPIVYIQGYFDNYTNE